MGLDVTNPRWAFVGGCMALVAVKEHVLPGPWQAPTLTLGGMFVAGLLFAVGGVGGVGPVRGHRFAGMGLVVFGFAAMPAAQTMFESGGYAAEHAVPLAIYSLVALAVGAAYILGAGKNE